MAQVASDVPVSYICPTQEHADPLIHLVAGQEVHVVAVVVQLSQLYEHVAQTGSDNPVSYRWPLQRQLLPDNHLVVGHVVQTTEDVQFSHV